MVRYFLGEEVVWDEKPDLRVSIAGVALENPARRPPALLGERKRCFLQTSTN
jgi:hypothetical protein